MPDDISTTILSLATKARIPPEQAAILARAVADRLRMLYGGSEMYIPITDPTAKAERDLAIRRAAQSGTPRDAVCRRFGISRSTYYRVLSHDQ